MSATSMHHKLPTENEYRPFPSKNHRSPCPALNTLANHGYISRNGQDLTFFQIVKAITHVYNLSYPLAFVLTSAGFITCGHISFSRSPSTNRSIKMPRHYALWALFPLIFLYDLAQSCLPRVLLHLSSLSRRDGFKIAHDASFVHANSIPSEAPDPRLVEELLEYALATRDVEGKPREGLSLIDIARFHAHRMDSTSTPLGSVHRQISLGECALTWNVLRGHQHHSECSDHGQPFCEFKGRVDGVIPAHRLYQWFGEERLPDGWWDIDGVRPHKTIGIIRTRMLADLIGILAAGETRKQ